MAITIVNGTVLSDGVEVTRTSMLALSESDPAAYVTLCSEIVAATWDTIPDAVKEVLIAENEAGARKIGEISKYLGDFDTIVTSLNEKSAEYGGDVMFEALVAAGGNDKVLKRLFETKSEMGWQYFNNVAGLTKLVLGLKGDGTIPAMTAAAITAQNNFAQAKK